jgi:NDP-sugar pyrophosphorylase family protein
MKAVILAGGLGKRLRPVVSEVPKPMAEVFGKPFLEWQIGLLKKFGLREVVVSIGYMGDKIKDHFGDGRRFGVSIEYAEESEPLGTGGGLGNASRYLVSEKRFLVVSGDTYLDLDFPAFLKFHEEKRAMITMALARRDKPSKSGCVRIDEDGRITEFVERKRGAGLINAGYLLFNSEVLNYMPKRDKFSLEYDVYPKLIKMGRVFGYVESGYFRDMGSPEDYELIKKESEAVVRR